MTNIFRKTIICLASVSLISGCATSVAYRPATGKNQTSTVKYDHGTATITSKSDSSDVAMYATFKTEPTPNTPTFSLVFGNKSTNSTDIDVSNVRAFFNGVPVKVWTYEDKISQIRQDKQAAQVAIVLLTVLAGVSAARANSQQTYTTNSSGYVGRTPYSYSSRTTVYDPMAGFVTGAAIGAAGGVALNQVNYSANAAEDAANSILQRTTVEPNMATNGILILKECCAINNTNNIDVIRFEVTINDKVHVFEFERAILK